MVYWIPYPMVRVVVWFMMGIAAGFLLPEFPAERTAVVLFFFLIAVYFFCCAVYRHHAWRSAITGIMGSAALFLAGYLGLLETSSFRRGDHFQNSGSPTDFYAATIVTVADREATLTLEVEVEHVRCRNAWRRASGRALVIIPREKHPQVFYYGDNVLIRGMPSSLLPPANPHEFDFRAFMALRNIAHEHRAKMSEIRVVAHAGHRGILFYAQQARNWASDQIRTFVPGSSSQSITLALVLGIVERIDRDLRDAYAVSGAMHVLSVSGLHVGVIYAIVLFFFKPFRGSSRSRWGVAFLSVVCLWAYAVVTGLSPSVLRAVMMFSFVAVAKPFGRSTAIYNSLAASAFLLLLADPRLLMSVGFQLSYLAVIGIVYFYPPLYQQLTPSSVVLRKVWQASCVSIATQLATFAPGLFYFHQFPVYALLSNLIVVPLSTAVLVVGIVLLVVSPFPVLATITGKVIYLLVSLLNGSVFAMEKFPFAVLRDVQISGLQCGLLVGIMVSLVLLFRLRKIGFATSAFVLAIVFAVAQWEHFRVDVDKERFTVYAIRGRGVIEWMERAHAYVFSDTALHVRDDPFRFHVRPNESFCGVAESAVRMNDRRWWVSRRGLRLFCFGSAIVAWIDQKGVDLPAGKTVDFLVIGHDALPSFEAIHCADIRKIILDGSNSRSFIRRVMQEAEIKNIFVHSVSEDGAFTTTF